MMIKKFKDEQNKVIQEFNQNLTQKNKNYRRHQTSLIKLIKLSQNEKNKINWNQKNEGGKVVEISNTSWCFCLCEQAIPKTGKIQFAFQMISGSSFIVEIGFREIMQKNNYYDCNKTGTYLIKEDCYTYSHHTKNLQSKIIILIYKQ
ncbi:unnamed protein product [Paramecium pentaurelia]|uniref:Uncharacterized protein n=1 Tax=Paramecium pentaurelia TaxID=43138 RepID=A0A8S1VDF6_9CILI|nr:unnamed protein product [Paramecium pentaurelia]